MFDAMWGNCRPLLYIHFFSCRTFTFWNFYIVTIFTSLLTPHPRLTPRPQRAPGSSPGSSVRTEFHGQKARILWHHWWRAKGWVMFGHSTFTELLVWWKVTMQVEFCIIFLIFPLFNFSTLIQCRENERTHRHSHSFLWGYGNMKMWVPPLNQALTVCHMPLYTSMQESQNSHFSTSPRLRTEFRDLWATKNPSLSHQVIFVALWNLEFLQFFRIISTKHYNPYWSLCITRYLTQTNNFLFTVHHRIFKKIEHNSHWIKPQQNPLLCWTERIFHWHTDKSKSDQAETPWSHKKKRFLSGLEMEKRSCGVHIMFNQLSHFLADKLESWNPQYTHQKSYYEYHQQK